MSMLFPLEARGAFDFVAERVGMSFVMANEREVRYEREGVFLIVKFDGRRSYELNVEIGKGLSNKPVCSCSLAEVLSIKGAKDGGAIDGIMASEATRLRGVLQRLAALTLQYASAFLMGGDSSLCEQVAEMRRRDIDAYALDGALRTARALSQAAWQVRNYRDVVMLLEPLEQLLTPAERTRLDYARRHIAL